MSSVIFVTIVKRDIEQSTLYHLLQSGGQLAAGEKGTGANAKDGYGFTGAINVFTHFCVNEEVTVESSSTKTDQP